MKREEVLGAAATAVMIDRNADHGAPEESFELIADLWAAYLNIEVYPADVAAMMALLKIARIRNNPRHADSWVDLAGYAACGAEVAAVDEAKYAEAIKWSKEFMDHIKNATLGKCKCPVCTADAKDDPGPTIQ